MAFQNADAIQKLYVAYFNRPADYYGLQFWDKVVTDAKGDTSAISAAFAGSQEYKDTYAGMDLRNTINAVYKNLFGHSADLPGLDFWTNAVNTGAMTLSNAVTEIAKGAQNADKIAYDSKVAAATAFTNALDTTDEILGYSGTKANDAAKQFIASVKDASTLATAITPANLDNSINGVIGSGSTSQTIALTKGLDNVTGTAGNDVIIGSIDSAEGGNAELNTLSSIDIINGGAGIDTLKVAHASGEINLGNVSNVEIIEISSAATNGVTVDSSAVAGVTNLNIAKAAGTVTAAAAATTDIGVSLKDFASQTPHTINVAGGKNVNVAVTDAASAINVGVAGAADATGAVTISATGAAAANNADITMGAIKVEGGKTISVTQKATVNGAAIVADGTAETAFQGNVSIKANASTTDVTVKQDADVEAESRTAVTGVTESVSVKFTALEATQSVTVAGLTFTAAKALTAAEVAQAFANLSATAVKPAQLAGTPATATGDTQGSGVTANGTFSGSLASFVPAQNNTQVAGGSWASGAATGDTVVFTGKANTDQIDLVLSDKATVVATTQGVTAVSALNTMGVVAGTVSIEGAAALKTVTVDGYAQNVESSLMQTPTSGVTGSSNAALDTITVANGGDFSVASAAATVALNLTNVDGTVSIAAGTKTINANVTGDDTAVTLVSGSAQSVNVKGTGNVMGDTTDGLNAATAINTSAMTGGTASFTIADGTVTTYTGGAGADDVTITNAGTAITKAIDLGAGDDILTLSGTVVAPTATLNGGAGIDTIAMNGASAAALSANATFAGKIEGFEKLSIIDKVTATTTVNMANMDGINYVVTNGSTTSTPSTGNAQKYVFNIAGLQIDTGAKLIVGGQTVFTATADNTVASDIATGIGATVAIAGVTYTVTKDGTAITLTSATNVAAQPAISVTTSGAVDTPATNAGVTTTAGVADVSGGVAALTIDKMVNNGTVELVGESNGVIVKMADATGSADSFNIVTTVVDGSLNFGTVTVAGVETIKLNAADAQPTSDGAPSIQTGTLVLNADKATSLTITGNSHVNLSLGADTKSLATVDASALTGKLAFAANGSIAVTVTGGSAADTLKASVGINAKADVINGGAGNDIIYAGSNGAKLTGGDGNDTFIVTSTAIDGGNKQANTYSEILDFKAGDILQLRAFVGGAAGTDAGTWIGGNTADVSSVAKLAATLNEGTAQFTDFVNAAIKEAGEGAAVWFSYKGDTYVTVDSGVNTEAFVNGEDLIVKLTGINGDNLSFNSSFGTLALV